MRMFKHDPHSDCFKILDGCTEEQIKALKDTLKQHESNYRVNLLTQQVDDIFGVTRLTDCVHREVSRLNGIKVY